VSITNINFFYDSHVYTSTHITVIFLSKRNKVTCCIQCFRWYLRILHELCIFRRSTLLDYTTHGAIQSHFVFLNISEALYTTLKIA